MKQSEQGRDQQPVQQSNQQAEPQADQRQTHLSRSLEGRHIQLLALGGAIGTGLFMGAGKIISLAGTSIILVYLIIGVMVFLIMRAMGEMLLSNLHFKSFADLIAAYLGPRAAFMLSWSYWFSWTIAIIGDMVVVAGYFQYWYPAVPTWMPAFFMLFVLLGTNLLAVRIFGELEFWFSLIKIIAIVGLIAAAFFMIAGSYVSPTGVTATLNHMVDADSFMPNGLFGFFAAFQIAIFSFAGTELVGTTAAEAKQPERTLPRAINAIPLRILVFYILSLIGIISVMSWQHVPDDRSPFVELFGFAGLPAAAGMINFVVLTSAASAANSGIYSSSRMLFGLALRDQGPVSFGRISRHGIPLSGIVFSGSCCFIGLLLLVFIPKVMTVFMLLTSICTVIILYIWGLILAAYLAYRKRFPELNRQSLYPVPGGRLAAWLAMGFVWFAVVLLGMSELTRIGLFLLPLWLGLLLISYRLGKRDRAGPVAPEQS